MKKKLLIFWTSRTFVEVFNRIVPELAENFEIVVLLFNYSCPPKMIEVLDDWKKNGVIDKYLVTPEHKKIVMTHLFMRKVIKELKLYDFDVWLTGSEMQVVERYIRECVLPKSCISIIFWHNITYLLMYNESMVRDLLVGTESEKYLSPERTSPGRKQIGFKKFSVKVKKIRSLSDIIFKFLPLFFGYSKRKYYSLVYKKLCGYCDRYIFPLVISGKTFFLKRYDTLTQIGSGGAASVIFTDEIEAQSHKLLFKTPNIYVTQYPTYGSCRCNGNKKDEAVILSPLSGFVGRKDIPQEVLSLFCRDFKTVLSKTAAKSVHLRMHPDETGNWYNQLREYLVQQGVNAGLVDCKLPIREVMCNYVGMAGYASAALRDGRASCDYAFVVGFEGVSRFQFNNPRFVFGKSEGIGWINEDGSYDQKIFSKDRYVPLPRKTLPEILNELSKNRKKE